MKHFLILGLLVCALMATPVLAGPTFRFTTQAEVLGFHKLAGFTNDGDATAVTTFNDGTYGGSVTYTQTFQVGIVADRVGEDKGTLNYIGIGDDGFSWSVDTYDAFSMTIANDNDDDWDHRVFAYDGSTTVYGSWTTIIGNKNPAWVTTDIKTLTVLLPSGFGSNNITLGFQVGSAVNENMIHSSVLIPAPGAILLGSIGAGLVGWLRRRML